MCLHVTHFTHIYMSEMFIFIPPRWNLIVKSAGLGVSSLIWDRCFVFWSLLENLSICLPGLLLRAEQKGLTLLKAHSK